jgi:hypothetical protein
MKAKVLNQIFYGLCFFLIASSIVFAVDHGIKGEYRDMHNSLNWVLWISITLSLMYIINRREVIMQAKDDYIESLETYKTLSDDHAVSMKEMYQAQKAYSTGLEEHIKNYKGLISDYQKLNEMNEKIIEEYKNPKPSRF